MATGYPHISAFHHINQNCATTIFVRRRLHQHPTKWPIPLVYVINLLAYEHWIHRVTRSKGGVLSSKMWQKLGTQCHAHISQYRFLGSKLVWPITYDHEQQRLMTGWLWKSVVSNFMFWPAWVTTLSNTPVAAAISLQWNIQSSTEHFKPRVVCL